MINHPSRPTIAAAYPAVLLLAGLAAAILVRLWLLPVPGLMADLDGFARWASGVSGGSFAHAYDSGLVYPAVMPYVWRLVSILEPDLATARDATSASVLVALKLPAVLADLALALGVGYHLRAHPRWAVVTTLAILLHPAVINISAWWGQFDSLYALGALAAYRLVTGGRPNLAAVALAVMVMTKPQAAPLLIPFAAWYLARLGIRGSVRPALVGLATTLVLWLPFLAANGPQVYLQNLADNQDGAFGVLSLRAWNPWWMLQVVAANGDFALDSGRIAGPITFRTASLVIAGLLELAVFATVHRSPNPRTLAWGVASSALVAVVALTTMHERYAYPALILLALVFPDRRAVALWLALSVVFTLNVLAAVPPTPEIGALLPVGGVLGIAGSLAMTAIAVACLLVTRQLGLVRSGGVDEEAGPRGSGLLRRRTAAEPAG